MDKFKDFLIVALVGIFSFPLIYVVVLFLNGTIRIEYGPKEKIPEDKQQVQMMKRNNKIDTMIVSHSRTFQALQIEKADVENERKRLMEQQERIALQTSELEAQQAVLAAERKKLEALVSKSDSLEKKKFRDQAKVYSAMKPIEAAQIIETLTDDQASKILNAMTDDRQKARILSSLSREKAARLTLKLGGEPK